VSRLLWIRGCSTRTVQVFQPSGASTPMHPDAILVLDGSIEREYMLSCVHSREHAEHASGRPRVYDSKHVPPVRSLRRVNPKDQKYSTYQIQRTKVNLTRFQISGPRLGFCFCSDVLMALT